MAVRYRKPKMWRVTGVLAGVIGDSPYVDDSKTPRNNAAWKNANRLRHSPTKAEKELELILNTLNHGVLKGRFFTQWAFADKWILDFFFYENRLGIEVDGSIHTTTKQTIRDRAKEATCLEWDITLIRISNAEVFGDQEHLVEILREGWKVATRKIKTSRFRPQ